MTISAPLQEAPAVPDPRALSLLVAGIRLGRAAIRLPVDLLAVAICDEAVELVARSVEARAGRAPQSQPWVTPPASLAAARDAVTARADDLLAELHHRHLPDVERVEALHHALTDLALLLEARVLVSATG